MSLIQLKAHDKVVLTHGEAGASLHELEALDWVEAGVAALSESRFGVELQFGPFVGAVALPSGIRIEVGELIPGAARACLEIVAGRSRTVNGGGAGSTAPNQALALRYVAEAERAIAAGPLKRYVTTLEESTRPRGTVNLSRTVRGPWARGHFDRVVSRRRLLTEDTDVNRYLLAGAVRAVQVLGPHPELPRAQLLVSRLLGASLLRRPSRPLNIVEESGLAIALADRLIEGVPISSLEPGAQSVYWMNAEKLFEDAVTEIFRQLCPDGFVDVGSSFKKSLLERRSSDPATLRKRADPDTVIEFRTQRLVIDAKYRRAKTLSSGEIYQLLAHADAFRATGAALVSAEAGARDAMRLLGRQASGAPIYALKVDPRDEQGMRVTFNRWLRTVRGVGVGAAQAAMS